MTVWYVLLYRTYLNFIYSKLNKFYVAKTALTNIETVKCTNMSKCNNKENKEKLKHQTIKVLNAIIF